MDEGAVGLLQLADQTGGDDDVLGAVAQGGLDDVVSVPLALLLPQVLVEEVLLIAVPVLGVWEAVLMMFPMKPGR